MLYGDLEVDERNSELQGTEVNLDLRVLKVRGTSIIAKVLTIVPNEITRSAKIQKGLNSEDNIILTVQVRNECFVVSITRLVDLKPIARVEFLHENAVEEDVYMTQETLVN